MDKFELVVGSVAGNTGNIVRKHFDNIVLLGTSQIELRGDNTLEATKRNEYSFRQGIILDLDEPEQELIEKLTQFVK